MHRVSFLIACRTLGVLELQRRDVRMFGRICSALVHSMLGRVLLPAGKPGTKRDLDGNEVPQKRSKAAAAGGGGDAMDVSLPSPTVSAPARQGERSWHNEEHTVFVKGMGYQVKEEDLRQLFGGMAVRAVRMGLDRETGQARVSEQQQWLFLARATTFVIVRVALLWWELSAGIFAIEAGIQIMQVVVCDSSFNVCV